MKMPKKIRDEAGANGSRTSEPGMRERTELMFVWLI